MPEWIHITFFVDCRLAKGSGVSICQQTQALLCTPKALLTAAGKCVNHQIVATGGSLKTVELWVYA